MKEFEQGVAMQRASMVVQEGGEEQRSSDDCLGGFEAVVSGCSTSSDRWMEEDRFGGSGTTLMKLVMTRDPFARF